MGGHPRRWGERGRLLQTPDMTSKWEMEGQEATVNSAPGRGTDKKAWRKKVAFWVEDTERHPWG